MRKIRSAAISRCAPLALAIGMGTFVVAPHVSAQELGVVRGPGDANPIKRGDKPGYDFQDQYIGIPGKQVARNMEPVIDHPDQQAEAQQKLAELEKRTGKKPNILVFILDDVGWMDFGFNGGGVSVGAPTPDVDRIANQGLILTSAYSQPTCTPTRATILTGQLPLHHGLLRPPMYGQPGGLEGKITIAKLLQQQGYTTQAIGKWHVGENVGSQPHSLGFDDFRGFLSVSNMYTEWRDPQFNPEVVYSPTRTKMLESLPFNKNDIHIDKDGKIDNVGLIDVDYMRDLDQKWTEYGENFIKKQKDSSKPFFLYFATRGCHFDNYPNSYYAGRSPARNDFTDCMVEMNDNFARLVKTLEDTGQIDNTLILLTSDNGPEAEIAPHARTPFRGSKGSTWEGGVRVPTFAYWKGMIEPRRSDGLFDLADLLPTTLGLTGIRGADIGARMGKGEYLDGVDQTSFLLAKEGASNRRSILYIWTDRLAAVRMDEMKYTMLIQAPYSATPNGHHGGVTGTVAQSAGGMMFNLYSNPQEDDSIAVRHIPTATAFSFEVARYNKVLKEYPSKILINFTGF